MTECASSTTGTARPLPGSDAKIAGLKYDRLSTDTETFAAGLVSGILAGDASIVPVIQVDQFGYPDAEGDQLRQHFHGPTSEFPRSWGACNAGRPQSLGKHGKTSFVLVEVTCPSKSTPWDKIAVGVQIGSGKTTGICFNVGGARQHCATFEGHTITASGRRGRDELAIEIIDSLAALCLMQQI
jgi:hypothetical protein